MWADRVLVRVMFIVALTAGVVACAESDAGAPSTTATPAECPPADVADSVEITVQRAELLLGFSEANAQRNSVGHIESGSVMAKASLSPKTIRCSGSP